MNFILLKINGGQHGKKLIQVYKSIQLKFGLSIKIKISYLLLIKKSKLIGLNIKYLKYNKLFNNNILKLNNLT